MKLSNQVKVLLGIGLVVVAYNYLRNKSKENMGVATKPASEPTKGFTKGFLNATANSTVIGGVQYTCPSGQEVLVDGSGVVGCYIQNPEGDLEWQGRPKKTTPTSPSVVSV